MGWEKKETIPNAPPFQSVITQCPFAAFSVCVHTFSSLSSFTVCVHTVSICRLFCLRSYFFVPFKFHSLCSHSVHLPPFLSAFILFRPFQVSQSVFTQCPFAAFSVCVHTFSSLSSFTVCVHTVSICRLFCLCSYFFVPFKFHSLCSHSVHLPPFLSEFILFRPFQVSQSVFTQCPFAAFSVCVHAFSSLSSFTVCVHTVSICRLFCLCSYFFVPFKFHSLCSHSVHLPPFLSVFVLFLSLSSFTVCVHTVSICRLFCLCSYFFIPFKFHSLCSHSVHLPPFHSLYSYSVHLLPFQSQGGWLSSCSL